MKTQLPKSCEDCAEYGSEFCEDCLEEITQDLPPEDKHKLSKALINIGKSLTTPKDPV